jgi:hypothetical protein
MGYDPQTLAFSFPPYPAGEMAYDPKRRTLKPKSRSLGRFLYSLKPFIGFDIWHVDPEKPKSGQRRDDSCGWFDRRPGPYADAVAWVLKDTEHLHEIRRAIATRAPVTGVYGHTYPRMSLGETLALCLMVANELELRRWWNGEGGNGGAHASFLKRTFTRKHDVTGIAQKLALTPYDNLSAVDEPEELVRLLAGALHRHYRPWWKHPRWHVHHWQVNFDLARNLRRMFQRCATCKRRLGFGYCPTQSGSALHHGECLGHGVATTQPQARMGL